MATTSSCPQLGALTKLVTGHLPALEMESLVQHLESCDRCLAKVQTLAPPDTLVAELPRATTLGDASDEPVVAQLITRLTRLRTAPAARADAADSADNTLAASAEAVPALAVVGTPVTVPTPVLIDGICDEFEKARHAGDDKPLEDWLPADTALEQMVLVELVRVELQLRLAAGVPARVEEYLARFPQLTADPPAILRLLAAEFQQRQRSEPSLDQDEYRRRFPHLAGHSGWATHFGLVKTAGSGPTQLATVGNEDSAKLTDFLAPALQPDELGRLGPYRVLEILGQGGMGVVFRAEDPQLKRLVALKAMLPSLAASSSAKKRFLREAQSAAALKHDHIVTIHQVGEDRGAPFLAMELLEGESLDERLKREDQLAVKDALRIGREIAEGLAAAHDRGLIHRDIKPGNIWLETRNDNPIPLSGHPSSLSARVKILDFGLARLVGDQVGLTQQGTIIGTPAYMAPEQVGGDEIDPRCDLFSLGCVLYRLCTGEMPFKGKDTLTILSSLAKDTPRTPLELEPTLPARLSDLIMQLLAKHPDDRPASAHAVLEALHALEGDQDAEQLVQRKTKAAPRRRRSLRLGVAAALLLAVLGGGYWLYQIVIIRDRDGKEVARYKVPTDGKVEVVPDGKEVGPNAPPVPEAQSPLDKLDPNAIPEAERFPWQPKDLVAVIGEHRGRNWGHIHQVAWSPDGKFVANEGQGGVVLWDPRTLRQRAILRGLHYSRFTFAPNGKILATNSQGNLQLWDLGEGEPKERGAPVSSGAVCLAFSPDGKTLAGGGGDNTVRLWDVTGAKPKEQAVLKGHTGRVTAVAFAPDGKTLASGSEDKTMRLWGLSGAAPKEKALVKRKDVSTHQLVFSPDGKTLAELGGAARVRFWDVTGPEPKEKVAFSDAWDVSIAFSPNGKAFARTNQFGLHLIDLTGVEPREMALLKTDHLTWLAFSPDGKRLVTAGESGLLRLWDLSGSEPKELLEPEGHLGPLSGATLAPDGKTLATYAWDSVVRLRDLSGTSPRQRGELRGHNGKVYHVAFSPDSKTLATCDGSMTVRLWDLTKADPELRAMFTPPGVHGFLSFAPDGKTLACDSITSKDSEIALWDVSGEEPKERVVLPDSARPFAFSPDGKTLVCFRLEKNILKGLLWDLSGAKPKEQAAFTSTLDVIFRHGESGLAYAPDGKMLAVTSYDGNEPSVGLWNMTGAKPKERGYLKEGSCHPFAFAPDGKTLACANSDGVLLWDVAKEKLLRKWRMPGGFKSLSFAPDGRHLITGNANGTAYILRLSPTPATKP